MFLLKFLRSTALLYVCASPALAQSMVLNYSGRISVDGVPFNGLGAFAFSIQETNGVTWWNSSALPFEGSTNLPPRVVKLAVKDGLYNIRLGDPLLGMSSLDLDTLRRANFPQLRVWFNDGTNGWGRVVSDVLLGENLSAIYKSAPMTSAQAEALLRELRDVRALFERPRSSAPVAAAALPQPTSMATVSIKGCPSIGRADAPLVLVEFVDFECPFCKEAHEIALPELKKKFVETGKVRFVMRHLTMPFHSHAQAAARAAICADQQQLFWPMHDKLFTISTDLNTTNILKAAAELNMDLQAFTACLETNTANAVIKQDGQDAQAASIRGTPTFVLGKASGDQVTGEVLVGAQSPAFFENEIRKQLGAN
jgi:protein-disulfide isomerase